MTEDAILIGLWIVGAFCLLVIGEWIHYSVKAGQSTLYTKNGSPVNVDQHKEERARVLQSINVHKAVSPHVRRVK